MVKKQLFSNDYIKPTVVEIEVHVEAGFAVSDQFENLEEQQPDSGF